LTNEYINTRKYIRYSLSLKKIAKRIIRAWARLLMTSTFFFPQTSIKTPEKRPTKAAGKPYNNQTKAIASVEEVLL
jgi:hypothetical protein